MIQNEIRDKISVFFARLKIALSLYVLHHESEPQARLTQKFVLSSHLESPIIF